MSNVIPFNPQANLPARVANRSKGELSALAKALAGNMPAVKRISIKGGVFRLVHGNKELAKVEERYLDVVLVNAAPNTSRKWYAKEFDKDEAGQAPDCWSNDGITSDEKAKNRQSVKCSDCPKNVAGSGKGNSRACRFEHRVAVTLANDMEGDVLALAVPGASVFGDDAGDYRPLKNYARYLAAQNVDPSEVVTRMKFDTDAEAPKLFFKAMRWLTDEEYATAQEKGKTDDAQNAVVMTVAAIDGTAKDAPVSKELGERPQRAAAPAEAPAPEPKAKAKVEDDEPPPPAPKAKGGKKTEAAAPAPAPADEDVGEPTVRKEDKPSPVKGAGNLAAAISEWDD